MSKFKKIPLSFYQREDALALSRALIGKYLFSRIGEEGAVTGGMIIETEAYLGAEDKACHAYGNRRTKRTETLFSLGGVAYVYFCYGMHHLLNIVCHREDVPQAVLIRAIRPEVGVDLMLKRRKMLKPEKNLASGPGMVCQALGITKAQNGVLLNGDAIWLEDHHMIVPQEAIRATPRIGVDYAEEDALKHWRFVYDSDHFI